MAYATLADVTALQPNRPITATSTPNASQVARYLDLTAADIDAVIAGRGYQLPIPTTATSALMVLTHGNALAARARIEEAAPVKAASGALGEWENWRQELRDGKLDLVGATVEQTPVRGGQVASAFFRRNMQF